jgi:sugar phosphate isomerase/epimerase
VELVVTPDMLARWNDALYWQGVRDLFRDRGLAFRNVHMGAPFLLGPEAHRPGLSALDPALRALKIQAAERCLSIAVYLGCPHVTLTTGLTESEADRPAQAQAFRLALRGLLGRLPKSVKILIEQEPEHVINSAAQLLALGREFQGYVFATFDVGHSHVLGEDTPAAIRALGDLIRNVHLEDIQGRVHAHKLYGEGDMDFAAIFAALHSIGYRGDYTPDLYPFKDDYATAMAASLAFLRRQGVLTQAL